MAREIHVIKY